MASGSAKHTTASTHACGFGAASVGSTTTLSRSCLTGWCRSDITAYVAGNRPVNGLLLVSPLNRQRCTARTQRSYPIHPRCGAGYKGVCSACGFGRESPQQRNISFCSTHHPYLGSARLLPYAPARGKKSVSRKVLDELKQQISLLEYLQAQDWQPARALSRGRWMGLCPLHTDHKPSFLVDPNKGLFYCYGCGRGGDVIRFAELYHQVNFPQAVALLRQWCGLAPLMNAVIDFYRIQLQRYNDAVIYLDQSGIHSSEVIEHMRIGYAPGRCLRSWL